MVEFVDNLFQMVLSAICTLVAFYHAFKIRRYNETAPVEESKISSMTFFVGRREWILYGLFTGECFLGDLFYVLHLAFYGETPENPYIPNLAWYASFLFLAILVLYVSGKKTVRMQSRLQLLIPLFTIAMAVFYVMDSGGIFDNALAAAVMTAAFWVTGGALEIERQNVKNNGHVSEKFSLYMAAFAAIVIEYALWTISSFWVGDSFANPYFWVDIMYSVNFIIIMIALKAAVRAENVEKTEVSE